MCSVEYFEFVGTYTDGRKLHRVKLVAEDLQQDVAEVLCRMSAIILKNRVFVVRNGKRIYMVDGTKYKYESECNL